MVACVLWIAEKYQWPRKFAYDDYDVFETHRPATTLITAGLNARSRRNRNLIIRVDLTLTFGLPQIQTSVLLSCTQEMHPALQKRGFHVVPAGFHSSPFSFSMAAWKRNSELFLGKFQTCCRVLNVVRDKISERLGWDLSLIVSLMLKTVLLSELFIKDPYPALG